MKKHWVRIGALLCVWMLLLSSCVPRRPAEESGTKSEETGGIGEDGSTSYETDDTYTRELAKKNQVFDAQDAVIDKIASDLPAASKDYTIMVYMIGSNLETNSGSASADMREMEAAGLDYSKTNLILYTGGSMRWNSDVPCSYNSVIDMSRSESARVVAGTKKNADMGAAVTLSAFVNFVTDNYPADHYALILWDHGGGPLWGYGSDELFEGDGLLLYEMQDAMEKTTFSGVKNLDFVGFDACLMGNLETMSVWARYADYFVGSEELEPGNGWDYHFLSKLNETDDPVAVTGEIVDDYETFYQEKQTEFYDPDLTLSVADLSKVDEVQTMLGELAEVMTQTFTTGRYPSVQESRSQTKAFGVMGSAEEGSLFSYDLVDLMDLALNLSSLDKTKARNLESAVRELIIKSYSNIEHAGGVTLYYPSSNKNQYYEMRDVYTQLRLNRQYEAFLERASRYWQMEAGHEGEVPKLQAVNGEYRLALTGTLREKAVSVTYSVLRKIGEGSYFPMMSRCSVKPDAGGTVHLEMDPKLIGLTTGGETVLWPVIQAEASSQRIIYQTKNTRLLSCGVSYFLRYDADAENITVILKEELSSGELSVLNINTLTDDTAFSGKETVDVSHYDGIFYYYAEKVPTWGEDGYLLSVAEWKDGEASGSVERSVTGSFGFTMVRASELAEELYYVVTIEDAAGTQYTTEPALITPERDFEFYETATDKGVLTYQLFPVEAVLVDYSGTDTELSIPEKVEGKLVTSIGPSVFAEKLSANGESQAPRLQKIILPASIRSIGAQAFLNCKYLREIILPSALQEIGTQAFAGCESLIMVKLPSCTVSIGPYAFAYCLSLKSLMIGARCASIGEGFTAVCPSLGELRVSGLNDDYRMESGALYTADGKVLLAYPAARTGSFTVREGTEIIGADAFSATSLGTITLPQSLRVIENYAFYGASDLAAPTFPEALETIGAYAFSAGWMSISLSDQTEQAAQQIYLGSQVKYVGNEAFVGFPIKYFEVSEENTAFSSREGALMVKAGDSLIELSTNRYKTFLVPEGCADFDISVMSQIGQYDPLDDSNPFQLYFPDSVIRITDTSIFFDRMVFHCSPGSAAEAYAIDYGIAVSYDTEPIRQEVTMETEGGVLTFWLGDTHATWARYEGEDTAVTIPDTIEGLPLTMVGDGLSPVQDLSTSSAGLTQVLLPDTVEVLQAYAFDGLSVNEMNLPSGVKVIGDYALNCPLSVEALPVSLENIGVGAFSSACRFENGLLIPASIERIAPGAFNGVMVSEFIMEGESDYCMVIDGMLYSADGAILIAAKMPDENGRIVIPDGTGFIGAYAFYLSEVQKVEIPASVMLIAQYAFTGCEKLTEITLPESVVTIGTGAFMGCGLESVVIPETVETVRDYAFYGCASLTSAQIHAKTIGTGAFAFCSSLKDLTLAQSVEEIDDFAFYDTAVAAVELPENLWIIGSYAFGSSRTVNADEALTIRIGENVSVLDGSSFSGIGAVRFEVAEDNPQFRSVDGMLLDKAGKVLIAVPSGISGALTVPSGVYEIASMAFENSLATDLSLPASTGYLTTSSLIGARAKVTLHLPEGSLLIRWAMEHDWPYVVE